MSYLVLARKLRPLRFVDLVGQDTIGRTLLNAIAIDRVAHAFLFTGPRGVGKTSCARILTKALNCLAPVEFEPCNECENCREITDNISADVMEIDAASNRGINHIRELRDNVKFTPAKSKYKTYIIDEVHMLTVESFNALLKILEEPPSHVKFILATTDPHKIPPTVISRCQRYDFVRIPLGAMVKYLQEVTNEEGIEISDSALRLIAGSATGGLRDALTSLDMLVSFTGDRISDEDVIQLLGLNDTVETDRMLHAIVSGDLSKALEVFYSLNDRGRSIPSLLSDLLGAVKDLSLIKSLSGSNQYHEWNLMPEQQKLYKALAEKCSLDQLQQYFHLILETENQIKRSEQAKTCFEMALVKMCHVEPLIGISELINHVREIGKKKSPLIQPR